MPICHDFILVPSLYYYYYYHYHHQYGRPSLADIVPKTQRIPHFVKHSSAGYVVIQQRNKVFAMGMTLLSQSFSFAVLILVKWKTQGKMIYT